MTNLTKYLSKYAEPETHLIADITWRRSYRHVIVVPVYKETNQFFIDFFNSQLAKQNALLIIVINQPDSDPDNTPQQQLFNELLNKGNRYSQSGSLSLIDFEDNNSSCLLVDRFSQPIDSQQGVGLARKIGVDIACQLSHQKIVTSRWVHSTDADAKLPCDYFNALSEQLNNSKIINPSNNAVAACYNFTHQSDDISLHNANAIYELSLRYYVAGLCYSESPYSFFTIGSTLAFNVESYASVRGFPKRSAGEDFYLLNKLAKIGSVLWLQESQLILQARESDRVPFGTGPAVTKILAQLSRNEPFTYYQPDIFKLLKVVNRALTTLYHCRNNIEQWPPFNNPVIMSAMLSIGLKKFVDKQLNSSEKQFNKQLLIWFDAFKTLKFIHYVRDNGFPNIELNKAVKLADFSIENVN